jgi:hypothetical protein
LAGQPIRRNSAAYRGLVGVLKRNSMICSIYRET